MRYPYKVAATRLGKTEVKDCTSAKHAQQVVDDFADYRWSNIHVHNVETGRLVSLPELAQRAIEEAGASARAQDGTGNDPGQNRGP